MFVRAATLLALTTAARTASADRARSLHPVHFRVAGHELKSKFPALSDGEQVYVPLEALPAVGAKGRENANHDAIKITTAGGKTSAELALARPKGHPSLLLRDLAELVNGQVLEYTPPAPDAKAAAPKPQETIYLLATVTQARVTDGALHVTTSFPVPYHTRMLAESRPLRGYIDCIGANCENTVKITPLADDEKRVTKLRAGQYDGETARIVVELRDGATLKSADSPANSATRILAGLEGEPQQIAQTPTQSPTAPDQRNPDTNSHVEPDATPDATPRTPRPAKTSRGSGTGTAPKRAPLPPVTIQAVNLTADDKTGVRLDIKTSARIAPYVHYQQNATQLVVEIANSLLKLANADRAEQQFTHPLISGLHAEQLAQDPPMTRITLDMNRVVGYSIDPQAHDFRLDLRLPRSATGALADKLIIVDAGHGGSSTGAVGHGSAGDVYEKNVTLAIALRLRTALEGCGARVVMTRDRDTDVALYDRPHLANDIKADLFISVHNDSNGRPNSASGTSTYYHMSDPSSRALAVCVQQAVSSVTGLPSRGALSDGILYSTGLAVLRVSVMPAVLCEVAYINNSRDRAKLTDPDFQQRVAIAMCRGIRNYIEGNTAREKPAPPKAKGRETEPTGKKKHGPTEKITALPSGAATDTE